MRDKALASSRGWAIVESLTTEVGPRLAGTEADIRAVAWAQELLQSSNFDRVWTEPVSIPVWRRHHEQARVVSPYPQPLRITALGYSGSTDGEMTAEVIGFPSMKAFKQADADTVAGKIVFINRKMERHKQGAGYPPVSRMRYTVVPAAKEKGAKAALIRSVGTDSHRFPHTGASVRSDNPFPTAALSAPDADQLQRMLDRGVPVRLALDIRVSERAEGITHNVIAQLNGRENPEEIVLIGAHLDSWDLGTGALDDGAGVAITTAAAELISQLEQRPRRSIRLVLFGNEEQGLWGAKAYAKQHADELARHVIASESDFGAGLVWRFDSANPDLMSTAMTALAALNIEQGKKPSSGGPDIGPLQQQGVPVFRLQQDGSDYFDYHHTADDTLDKIDPEKLQQNIAAWSVVTWLAAELPSVKRTANE
ncbi:aminopeptidase [Oceanicoccus sagamiensis]|uniref:Carboxypeptidase Q n=1 Tax=Oceanicoccus sagamiensis TaxID=716816 RepID=A0A1X9NFY8_9GAMM|nr:aminopeptidase [Oceanicoccus sagamiensis]